MGIGKRIRQIRKSKNLSQKEVIAEIDMGAAQYSRIESEKTEPSISTLERIAKALGIKMTELFSSERTEGIQEVNSQEKTLMEKVRLIESLSEEEKKTIFFLVDTFIGKKHLKETLAKAIKDIEKNL